MVPRGGGDFVIELACVGGAGRVIAQPGGGYDLNIRKHAKRRVEGLN